jgi:Arylsulfotransferase (ASST)
MRLRIGRYGYLAREVRLGAVLVLALWGVAAATCETNAASPQDTVKPPPAGAGAGKAKPEAPKLGLVVNEPRALQGYTVLAPIMSRKTYLLDMQGRVVRTWESESSSALSTYLLENGHLLRHAKLSQQVFGDGPGAGGHIQEFTWEGELVWDFKLASARQLPHHDICRMPNGNILMIVWEKKSAQEAVAAGRRPETVGKGSLLPDCIFEVQPAGKTGGKIVWEWHVWDHLIQDHDQTKANFGDVAAHPELIDINFGEGTMASIVAKKEELDKLRAIGYVDSASTGRKPAPVRADWLHTNAVSYNADLDQIMLSSPEFNEIWIIDHSTTEAEAAGHAGGRSGKGGDLLYRWGNPRAYRAGTVKDQKLFYQHNAQWIPPGFPGEGHLLVFNNGRRRPGGAHSSVDELILPVTADGHYEYKPGTAYGPDKPVWSYAAPKKADFYAEFISGTHRLPNGNTFICVGPSGTLFEVTPAKEIVWKYLNPAKPETGPGSGEPALVEIVPASLRDAVKTSDEQNKQFDDLQKEAEVKVDALLSDQQKKQLKGPPAGFGPGGPPAAPQRVQVLPALMRARLKLTDDQKKQLEALQKEAENRVEKTLTAEQRKQMKEVLEGFVNAWGGGPGGGGGPPRLGNAVFRSYRYAANYPGLARRDLKPGKTVEELQQKAFQEK